MQSAEEKEFNDVGEVTLESKALIFLEIGVFYIIGGAADDELTLCLVKEL